MRQGPDLRREYAAALALHGYEPDPSQRHVIEKLDALARRLRAAEARRTGSRLGSFLGRLRGAGHQLAGERGLYLWGGVGRGKTFLLDLFHAHAGVRSRREHFHRFMKDVHARLRDTREVADPLERVAAAMARDAHVLCFDELFVSDIGDAMLLAGLFEGLIARGVTLLFTSNAPPRELYRDGLQRQRFLPAIALIERHSEIMHLDGGLDYRLRQLQKAPLYLDSRDKGADAALAQRFHELADAPPGSAGAIEVEGRSIGYVAATDEVIWFDFAAICGGPRSQSDYIDIARDYHTVLVGDVPQLGATEEDEARRFIALVDEFYDRGVKLVISARAPLATLYTGERLAFAFERTRSRLVEMQTQAYLARPHKP